MSTASRIPQLSGRSFPPFSRAKPAPDVVDAADGDDGGDDDGLELADAEEALELMRKTIGDINGDVEDGGDDEKVDAMSSLGALALPARKIYVAHLQAKLAEDSAAQEKHAKAAADMARFVLQCHRRARGNAA
jgi:hypothetical protein